MVQSTNRGGLASVVKDLRQRSQESQETLPIAPSPRPAGRSGGGLASVVKDLRQQPQQPKFPFYHPSVEGAGGGLGHLVDTNLQRFLFKDFDASGVRLTSTDEKLSDLYGEFRGSKMDASDKSQTLADPGFIEFLGQKDPRVKAMWEQALRDLGQEKALEEFAGLFSAQKQAAVSDWEERNPKLKMLGYAGDAAQFATALGAARGIGMLGAKALPEVVKGAYRGASAKGIAGAGLRYGVNPAAQVAGADLLTQGARVGAGVQDGIDLRQTAAAAAAAPVGAVLGRMLGVSSTTLQKMGKEKTAYLSTLVEDTASFAAFNAAMKKMGPKPPEGSEEANFWDQAFGNLVDAMVMGAVAKRLPGAHPFAKQTEEAKAEFKAGIRAKGKPNNLDKRDIKTGEPIPVAGEKPEVPEGLVVGSRVTVDGKPGVVEQVGTTGVVLKGGEQHPFSALGAPTKPAPKETPPQSPPPASKPKAAPAKETPARPKPQETQTRSQPAPDAAKKKADPVENVVKAKSPDEVIRRVSEDQQNLAGLHPDTLKPVARVLGRSLRAVFDKKSPTYLNRSAAAHIKHAEKWRVNGRDIAMLESQKLLKKIEEGELSVRAMSGGPSGKFKLSDGRELETIHENTLSKHAMLRRREGHLLPGERGKKWHETDRQRYLEDLERGHDIHRRTWSVVDRAIEGAVGRKSGFARFYQKARKRIVETVEDPALAQLSDDARATIRREMEGVDRAETDMAEVLEKFSAKEQDHILEALWFYHQKLGDLPRAVVKDSADLDVLDKGVQTIRDAYDRLGQVFIDAGMLKQETVDKRKGEFVHRQMSRKEARKSATAAAFRDMVGKGNFLTDPWGMRDIMGMTHQRKLSTEEFIRQGGITDYRSSIDYLRNAIGKTAWLRMATKIAADPRMALPEDQIPANAKQAMAELDQAIKDAKKHLSKMAKKRVFVREEFEGQKKTERQLKMMSIARRTMLRAEKRLNDKGWPIDGTPSDLPDGMLPELKKLQRIFFAAETSWFKTIRMERHEMVRDLLAKGLRRKLWEDYDQNKEVAMNQKLEQLNAEVARLRGIQDWVKLSEIKGYGTGRQYGPLKGMAVHRTVHEAFVTPLRQSGAWQSVHNIHAFIKKQKTARRPGTHVTNGVSNMVGIQHLGINMAAPASWRHQRMSIAVMMHYTRTGRVEMPTQGMAAKMALGIKQSEIDALLPHMEVFLKSGFYDNSQFLVETRDYSRNLRDVERRLEEQKGEDQRGKASKWTHLEKLLIQFDTGLLNLDYYGTSLKALERAYAIADPAQAMGAYLNLVTGKGSFHPYKLDPEQAMQHVRDLLDFSQVSLLVQDVSKVVSFARIYYKLPQGAVRGFSSPGALEAMLMKVAPNKRLPLAAQYMTRIAAKLAPTITTFLTMHSYAQAAWGMTGEAGEKKYWDYVHQFGYQTGRAGLTRGFFSIPKFWQDKQGFVDISKYSPVVQSAMWGFGAWDTGWRWIESNRPAQEKSIPDEMLRDSIMLGPLMTFITGRGYFGQEQTAGEAFLEGAGTYLVPGLMESIGQAVPGAVGLPLGRKNLTLTQRALFLAGIRNRDSNEARMLNFVQERATDRGEISKKAYAFYQDNPDGSTSRDDSMDRRRRARRITRLRERDRRLRE